MDYNSIYIIIVNYNYSNIFYNNISYFKKLNLPLVFVDDQSTQYLWELEQIEKQIPLITTKGEKSLNNAINQLNAIKAGLEYYQRSFNDDDYIWVIDADDIPISSPVVKMRNLDCILYAHIENETKYFPSYNGMWFRNAPTSSILVKVSYLVRNENKIFNYNYGKDVWFDIRIGCFRPRFLIESEIIMEKVLHGENDSNRYKKNIFKKYYRILNTILYKFHV